MYGVTLEQLEDEAYNHLSTYFEMEKEDRKLCWVGVLDSRTVLLRRFRKVGEKILKIQLL